MNDKKQLLDKLRLDEGNRVSAPPSRRTLLLALGGGVAAVGLGLFFALSGAGAGPIEVRVAQVRELTGGVGSAEVLDASGYVTARRRTTVSSRVTGRVAEVLVEEGDRVEQGQLLARLDDSIDRAQLALSRAELDSARRSGEEVKVLLEEARRNLERLRGLAAQQLASVSALDAATTRVATIEGRLAVVDGGIAIAERRLELRRRMLADTEIRAPFAGVVVDKAAQPGEMISPVSGGGFTRTGICTIVDMGSLEVEVDVNEAYLNRVYRKQPARAQLNAYPDWRIPAEVIAIIPTADRSKATVRVRVALLERDRRILPDMGVQVAFLAGGAQEGAEARAGGLVVPEAALVTLVEGGAAVWVLADGILERRRVTLGERVGPNRRVLAGLEVGETLVLNPPEDLRPGVAAVVAEG